MSWCHARHAVLFHFMFSSFLGHREHHLHPSLHAVCEFVCVCVCALHESPGTHSVQRNRRRLTSVQDHRLSVRWFSTSPFPQVFIPDGSPYHSSSPNTHYGMIVSSLVCMSRIGRNDFEKLELRNAVPYSFVCFTVPLPSPP